MIFTGLSGFRTVDEEETKNRNENILYVKTLLLLYAYQCISKVFDRFCIPSLSTYFLTYFFAPLVFELALLGISTTFYVKTKWLKSQEIKSKLFILGKQSEKKISFCLVKVWRGGGHVWIQVWYLWSSMPSISDLKHHHNETRHNRKVCVISVINQFLLDLILNITLFELDTIEWSVWYLWLINSFYIWS